MTKATRFLAWLRPPGCLPLQHQVSTSSTDGARLQSFAPGTSFADWRATVSSSRLPGPGCGLSSLLSIANGGAGSPASSVWMLPLSILAVSEPPGLNQVPGSSIHRSTPLPGLLCGQSGRAEISPAFAGSRSVRFILADTRPLLEAPRHYFRSLRPVSPDHVLGVHATPFPPGGKVPPGRHPPAPGSYCDFRRFLSDLSFER